MEYNTVFFGDVAKIKNGYAFKSKEFQEKGIPVIKIKNIISPIVDTKDSQKVSIKTYEKTKNFSLKKNDILISLTGSGVNQMSSAVGKVGRIEFDYTALQNQRVGKFELKYSNSADLDFLFYYFLQPKITKYLVRNSTGSANQANINSKLIETVKIPNFSLIKQKSISKFLNQITRKIETNQKIIANLEELSQTLFKRWFVDFEFPDENGNSYKSSGGEMVESELGEIPKFWKISKLEEIIDYSNKSIDVEKSLDKLDYIGLEHIPKNNKISINNWEDSSKIKGKKTLVSKGDILFGKLRPYFQKIGISPINGVVSTDILVIRPKKEEFYYFLLVYISQNKFIQYTTNTATGTRMPRTGTKQINTYKLILPPVSTLELFNTTLKNITINILQKNQEIRTLEILRDTLLPKLMSGELEIPDDIEVNEDELSI